LENRIKEGKIKAFYNTTVCEITPNNVILNAAEGKIKIENDFVLAMTGYSPDFDLFSDLGIEIGTDDLKTPVVDERTFETTLPGVFMAGVILGGLKTNKYFIENTRDHAERIVRQIELRDSIC